MAARRLVGLRGEACDRRSDGRGVQEEQRVSADDDLVAVLERAPLDTAAVDVDAVERAVVESRRPDGR
jgi:hypothetical protein